LTISRGLARAGVPLLAILIGLGTFWAYQRGGLDFNVFYHAWRLVLEGHGSQIYVDSPDRFLYAPGFAWLLAPLGLFPEPIGLGVWSLLKAVTLAAIVRLFGKGRYGLAAIAALVMIRPLLIDFQYGQVNLLILGVCIWALWKHASLDKIERQSELSSESSRPPRRDRPWTYGVAWFLLGIAAVSKLFPLPLVILPWLRFPRSAQKTKISYERAGVFLGVIVTLFLPMISVGFHGALQLLFAWREALIAKGLPFESHNQSFAAFLHHYFTAEPTHIIALGSHWVVIGKDLLSLETITMLSIAWSLIFAGFLLGWLLRADWKDRERWIAVAVALLFIPSYLVWKPYFVFGVPAAILVGRRATRTSIWILAIAFVLINLTGFDMIGGALAGYLEAASLFLWVHLAIVAAVVLGLRFRH
jgi:hypothetical protein